MDSDKNIERIEQKIQELLGMDDSNEAEPLKYENKALRSVELELLEIEKKICCVERRLEKIPWTEDDKEKYGSKDYLREEKKQLREEKKQLREKEKQLREEKKQLREKENLLLKKKLSGILV